MTPTPNDNKVFKDFLKVFIVPMLINKFFMLYFGVNYSNNPGEGYGYGLIATVVFFLATCGRLIWKYRNVEDP